jgi:pimeloyl-ACP methyl ester carboxylesterase
METVQSKDGTRIAYDKMGSGPALILVDGAMCSRAFGPMPKLAPLLATKFTVYVYDRRGRGDSTDTKPYSLEREIEDIEALVAVAGGSASLLGLSSGAALAMHASTKIPGVKKVVAYEPPYMPDDHERHANHQARLLEMLTHDQRGDMIKYFMKDMVGAPGFVVVMMRLMPGVWKKLKAVAHTLPYDSAVMGDFSVPTQTFSGIKVPTLLSNGSKTEDRLKFAVNACAKAVPNAQYRELKGQNHNVNPEVLAPVAIDFLLS